jgi:Zn-dependent protease/CBS domain-containing protein
MEDSVRIGKIAGIRVGAHWSFLVVLGLIASGLTLGLSADYPGQREGSYLLAGAIGALALSGALLAHELGHAVMARRQGVPVEGITLWLLGGVTRMHGEAASPGGALRVALVGPLVSLGAALAFGVLALALDGAGAPGLVEGTARWLARANLVLAAFNLIPAAPLDGGRVLQALLWQRRGDRWAASATAAQAGRAFGYLLIGLGVLDAITGVGIGGLWSVLLGWFLVAAARAEQASAEARIGLQGLRVGDVMTRDPVAVPGWLTVDAFVEDYVLRQRSSAFPVQNLDGGLGGVVTVDALKQVPTYRRAATRVIELAVPIQRVPVARSDDMVLDLVDRLPPGAEGPSLVIDDGELVGIVSPADVRRALELAGLRGGGSAQPTGSR